MSVEDPDYELFNYTDTDTRALQAAARDRASKELQGLEKDLDLQKLVLRIAAGGGDKRQKRIAVEDAIISGEINRTVVGGASTITVTVHDQDRELLRSKNLVDDKGRLHTIDVELDGMWFRLVKARKTGDDVELTFEDVDVARLRRLKGPRLLGTRGKITRAQAILLLIQSVKERKIPHHINELKKEQPIDRAKKRDKEAIRDRKRSKGFDRGAIIDGKQGPLNKTQLDNAARAMAVADSLSSPDLASLALIEACIEEAPDFQNPTGGEGTSVGILQLTDIHHLSIEKRRDIEYVVHRFLAGPSFTGAEGGAGAIELARRHPNWTPGQIAQTIQGSQPARYENWRKQAERILNEWGRTGGGLTGKQIFKPYHFRVQRHETYWDAIQRMAKEVEWRAFFSAGEFYYISEEDLYKSRSRFTITEGEDGVSVIDGEQDRRKPFVRITVYCRIHRWQVPPGALFTVNDLGFMSKKFLVESITRSLYSAEATVEAKTPTPEEPEPRPDVRQLAGGAQAGDPPEVNIDDGAAGIVEQAIRIAISNGGAGVYVGNTKRSPVKLSGGSYEDHAEFNRMRAAADIGVRGVDMLVGPPPHQLDRAIVAIGRAFGRDYGNGRSGPFQNADNIQWRGFRIQVIWRTPEWGGHMGHIHFGVRSDEQSPTSLSGLPDLALPS